MTNIGNKDGLPLPTAFDGTPASEFLITADEQAARRRTMQATCRSCHGSSWVDGHWRRYHITIEVTNASVRVLTEMMSDAWLFYANTVRFASAMAGGGDYGVFADGCNRLSKSVSEMHDWLRERQGGD